MSKTTRVLFILFAGAFLLSLTSCTGLFGGNEKGRIILDFGGGARLVDPTGQTVSNFEVYCFPTTEGLSEQEAVDQFSMSSQENIESHKHIIAPDTTFYLDVEPGYWCIYMGVNIDGHFPYQGTAFVNLHPGEVQKVNIQLVNRQ